MRRFLVGALICLLDLGSKLVALTAIPPFSLETFPYGGIPVLHLPAFSISLNTVGNRGAAWGIFHQYPLALLAIRVALIAALCWYLWKRQYSTYRAWALTLITAGAVSNAIDFIWHGYVVDFILMTFGSYHFPIFNIADACITFGVLALLFERKQEHV